MGRSKEKQSVVKTYIKSKRDIEVYQKRLISLIRESNSFPGHSDELDKEIHNTQIALRRAKAAFKNAQQRIRAGVAAVAATGLFSVGVATYILSNKDSRFEDAETAYHEMVETPEEITRSSLSHFKEIVAQETGVPKERIWAHDNSYYDELSHKSITDLSIDVQKTDLFGNLLPEETIYKYYETFHSSDGTRYLDKSNNMPEDYVEIIQLISKAQTTDKIEDAKKAYVAVYKLSKEMNEKQEKATQNTMNENQSQYNSYRDDGDER